MSKSYRGPIVLTIVAVAVAAALGTAYAMRDKSASNTSITAVGSTALQPLVEAAGEEYAKDNLGTFINVQGGGTGTGLSQVSQGAVDIGNSDVFAEEKEGIDAKKLTDHQVAVVGIAPLLNKNNGVKNLTTKQLIAVFTGKVMNWKEVGGNDQKIVIINRAAGSGTRATFEQWGLNGAQSTEAQEQDSSGMVRSIVSTTPGAISYAAFGYIDDSVVAAKVNGVKPTKQNVVSGKYAIWSYEHVYTKGKPSEPVAKFLKYLTSKKVQSTLVSKLGYISIHDMKISRDVNGQVTRK
ncbi:phosphate ABC transporter substrate-binding protein PstS family protein [Leuconostoc mesenteroides]|jgi:phosphate transport system substrate-binding protein|uniref:Phosphate-binding protein n=1 Tax=Leuconostoc mesenteroides TaxID=1245 RepID=A0A843Z020_LEUME|nr:phosphate ABC transporter substrate-binding protein PstS family protein [Leuconostoc mesenteroides]ARN63064.1 phosphate ABC transporter substrate-binding protein [Leuconostoc mesenteroides subsp. mesenteroides]MBZ1514778.1 phosphate ABC transporter substrate-binding protein PstS family protein [Leuconostoc mesenteroides]MBZ1517979.1 phosphate ABC transporter substrate-binding protein PstS family protein [Leuconostoc mesenteroides]MBZ1519948.1 phosphate ABC transporter substrate-binding prote